MDMRIKDFLQGVAKRTRESLPEGYQDFKSRRRGSLIQFWYSEPRIHYEVWVQRRHNRVEVGLHLEAKKSLNDRILRYLADRFIAVQAELDPMVELEQWTHSWGRVHRFVPYERLGDSLCNQIAEELTHMIVVLEPFRVAAVGQSAQANAPQRGAVQE